MCDIVSYPGHRNAAARHMGNNYGLKLKELGGCRVELSTWLRPYIQIIGIAALAITVATIITTSVHFAVDKLGKIDDEVLVLASSKPEVENARGERDRARYVRRNKFYSYSR
jgi:hypothetical protein